MSHSVSVRGQSRHERFHSFCFSNPCLLLPFVRIQSYTQIRFSLGILGIVALRRPALIIGSFMTIFSLVAVVLLKKASLAMPGVYAGQIVAMLLGGERHGPLDPWS
jgi:hypothetical protein